MKDISIDAAWSHEEKHFYLNVGKAEILKGILATLNIRADQDGIFGFGSFPKIVLPPPPKKPILIIQ